MRLIYAGFALAFATCAIADTITLKNGSVINGTFLGGTARSVRVDAGDNIQNIDVADIVRIEFGGPPPTPPPTARREGILRAPDSAPPPPPPQYAAVGVTLPAGTTFVIRMIDAVDSEKARVGQSFAASLDQPVMVDGNSIVPRGADVVVKLVDSKESGKLAGKAEL